MSPALRGTLTQDDFSASMIRDVAPSLIPENGLYDLLDGLLDEDGNPYRRGGSAYKSSAGLGTGGLTWAWDGFLLPGQRTVIANDSDFGVLAADDEAIVNLGGAGLSLPKQAAALEEILFIGGGTLYGGSRMSAPYSTGTVKVEKGKRTVTGSGTTWNTLVDAGMLFQIGAERAYVVESIDSTTQITLRDDYEGTSGSGKSYALSPVLAASAGPYSTADFVCACAGRLVFGRGNKVTYTEVDNPHSSTNFTGKANEHELPDGVRIVGLATVGQSVLIFTTGGIWVLEGLAVAVVDQNGNSQHRLIQLSSDTVLAGATGLAGSGQQVIVPAADGVFLMDGISQPTRISKPVDRLYRYLIAEGFHLGKAAVFRGHYFLPILDNTAQVHELLVCRLDRPVRSRRQTSFPWARFSGDGGEITAFAVRMSDDARQPKLLGAQAREPSRVVDLTGYFNPTALIKNDADGSTFDLDLITRDYQTGEGTINAVRSIRPRYELVDDGDGPTLEVSYSDGSLITGEARWDEVNWDEFEWAGDGGASFNAIGEAPPSDGRDPYKLRVKGGKRLRFVRFRIRSNGPTPYCALRSIEIAIRPSGATRR